MYIQAWSAKDLRASVKAKVGNAVGAASSREINCRGWKPLPHKGLCGGPWTFHINKELNCEIREFFYSKRTLKRRIIHG
jgi:hypothetical protein